MKRTLGRWFAGCSAVDVCPAEAVGPISRTAISARGKAQRIRQNESMSIGFWLRAIGKGTGKEQSRENLDRRATASAGLRERPSVLGPAFTAEAVPSGHSTSFVG